MTKPARAAADRHTDSLAAEFARVRATTLALAAPLTAEDCQVQSMPDASPVKWHLGHVSWFFETFVLERFEPGFRPFDPAYRVLFNSYYQGIGEQSPRARRGLILQPGLEVVKTYRAQIDERIAALLDVRRGDTELAELVTLGLQHEQQHQELILTDIKHALSFSPAHRPYANRWPMARVQPAPTRWFGVDGGLVEHGHDELLDGGFRFDNETPRHRVFIEPFELASRPVSFGEFIDFVADGGYRRPELWLSLGWDWVCAHARQSPLYWQRDGQQWFNHTLQGRIEIDPHTPVCHLSYFEADAFARWAGARLPTEAEWELAARRFGDARTGHFADRGAFHPLPPSVAADAAPVQLFGDVWEWTASAYLPYPCFRPWAGAVGEYNGKFMCNQFVLRGGSCATPAGHVRASYRNFFPPEAQWQFSGLRLARNA
ncbi:ergothioneine biosynthesis protein EgtB [uncultured Piscinibacter sp.]|uniref:ergothioneine biosynthesis protein EgtB n=1 Tax=uncultured Piscinibacter sp. TaxID=1131835 RepID=UPI00261D28EC|nr:ergothioneine biosynthesis protein EgtB [uncultured Piscinibacter sp.]